MRFRALVHRLRRIIGYALVACWGLAFLANVQGWSVVGSDWLASGGSSFWTRCGSAMCACESQGWDGGAAAERAAAAIAEYCWAPGERVPWSDPGHEAGDSAGGGGLGLAFVAFGSHRRQHPDGTPIPEVSMIPAPAPVAFVDLLAVCGEAPRREGTPPEARPLDAPTPPPRSC